MSSFALKWARDVIAKGGSVLLSEFDQFIDWHTVSSPHKSSEQNSDKCRYYDIPCYDSNRVVLKDRERDFYHANRVMSPDDATLNFIAAQGPLSNTISDFWHLVMQERVPCIVQLCSFDEGPSALHGCARYWADDVGGSVPYGYFRPVTARRHPDIADGVEWRTIRLERKGCTPIEVEHVFVRCWPDFGVPDCVRPVAAVARWLDQRKKSDGEGPVLVHCLAGIGRTSTLIAVLFGLHALKQTKEPMDVLKGSSETCLDHETESTARPLMVRIARQLRAQRAYSIQTRMQYVYANACILYMLAEDKTIEMSELKGFPFCDAK